jgi:hypothetical protein
MSQFNCSALSQPFTIGSKVYIWVKHVADVQLGVATLLRIPIASEYANAVVLPYTRSWPIDATIDNRDIDDPVPAGQSGPTVATPALSALGYCALILATGESIVVGTQRLLRRFLLAPVRHRSEGLRHSVSCVLSVAGKQFVAGAQSHWVDERGAYEGGFIQAPVSAAALVPAVGGALTANSAYSYLAYFEATDSLGNVERSPTSVAVSITAAAMGVNTKVTAKFSILSLGSRQSVRCKLFRTLANGSEFFLVGSIDATPAASTASTFTFADVYADTDIIQNGAIYTQIGQELDAAQFPACTFATTGNSRLLCAGGFNGKTGHFSKMFTPGICPEFADDDAFRVTLPSNWTGVAYCDAWVAFTQESIWIVTGDGPDSSGAGFFSPASRLPYRVGCIDWRSVVTCDVGVFFQSARGLELLPRGFGPPVSIDQVQDTLAAFPIITSARAFGLNAQGEHVIRWTCVADEAATSGAVIIYDVTYQTWQVDTYSADFPATFQAEWLGAPVLAPATTTIGANGASFWHPFRVQNGGFSDGELPIPMLLRSGDMRLWGTFGYGVIHRAGLLGELRSACTLNVTKTTDQGTRSTVRVYTCSAPDPIVGNNTYLDIELGSTEHKDVTSLRLEMSETSATEGMAFVGIVIEHDEFQQSFRRPAPADRIG